MCVTDRIGLLVSVKKRGDKNNITKTTCKANHEALSIRRTLFVSCLALILVAFASCKRSKEKEMYTI